MSHESEEACKKMCVQAKLLQSCLTLCGSMDVAHQSPLFMEFSRQEYWSGLPCPPLGDIPNPGVEPASLKPLALAGGFFAASTTLEAPMIGQNIRQIFDLV